MSSTAALPLLRQYLDQQSNRGTTHTLLSVEARQALGRIARGQSAPRPQSAPADQATPAPSKAPTSLVQEPPVVASQVLEVQGSTREEKLARLAQLAEESTACRALGSLRDTMVFAVGNPHAQIMFVGEAPGAEEERQREPFVGPAGQLLTKIITAMGLKRTDVYISNICKFRPAIENQGSSNRKPTAEEMRACLPFISTEIAIIQPRVIIALGATAAEGLGIAGSVGKNRGRCHEAGGIPVVVTYHPSYLLRQEQEGGGIAAKRQSWEDMLLAMETAGMTISEKQRNFFRARP